MQPGTSIKWEGYLPVSQASVPTPTTGQTIFHDISDDLLKAKYADGSVVQILQAAPPAPPDTNTSIQASIRRDCHYSATNIDYRQYIISHGTVSGGAFSTNEEILGSDHGGNQFTARVVLVGSGYLLVTRQGDTNSTQNPRISVLYPGDTITGQTSGASAVIDVASGFSGGLNIAAVAGGMSPIDGLIMPQHYRDGNWSLPDATEIVADGWSGTADGWEDSGGDWSIPAGTYSDWWLQYGQLAIPSTGAISHSIVENVGGTTVIGITRSSSSANPWASNVVLKDSGGTTVATVALSGNATGTGDGIVLKDAADAIVTKVWEGQSGENTPVYQEAFTFWIRIDWATGSICVIAQPEPGHDFNTVSFTDFAVSDEYAWTGNKPAELSIEGVTATVRYTEVVIMDDPWLLIGDSITVQMNRDTWGPQLATVLNRDHAVIDLSQGSSGYLLDVTRAWSVMAVSGGLDKFRSPRLCIGTLGINDINGGKTTADISTALSTMLAALDGGNDATSGRLKQVIATQIPPGNLTTASTAIADLNAEIVARVADWSPSSRVADLNTLMTSTSESGTHTVIKRRYRRAVDAGTSFPREEHGQDAASNIHLSREGAMAGVAEIGSVAALVI